MNINYTDRSQTDFPCNPCKFPTKGNNILQFDKSFGRWIIITKVSILLVLEVAYQRESNTNTLIYTPEKAIRRKSVKMVKVIKENYE